MAFQEKLDYVGLTKPNGGTPQVSSLGLKANAQNRSLQNLQIIKSTGEIQCDETYGDTYAPTCEYTVNANTNLDIYKLGKVYGVSIGDKKFGLQQIVVSTSAGGEPTVNATGVQLEEGATQTESIYSIPQITVTPARHAQTFDLGFGIQNEQCCMTLQSTTLTVSATIDPATINGDPVASDATQGVATFEVTVWSRSEVKDPTQVMTGDDGNEVKFVVPTETGVPENLKWHITSPWTCVGSDSSMFVWTATYTKYLRIDNSNPRTYSVELNKNGGTGSDLTSYTYGVDTMLPELTREGYDFDGWFKDPELTDGPYDRISADTQGAKEYWAKFTETPEEP